MRGRVYVAHTGGTIGMARGARGYAPSPGFLAGLMADMPELAREEMPEHAVGEFDPLLDSADIGPGDWLHIARAIADRYDEYDGFVVLHGTDTMAYTASGLAFMFEALAKPVILTGSQIPLCEVRSDARENLISALLIAARHRIPEVCLYFGGHLLRGCRAKKVNAEGFDAFASPNFPPLGKVGLDIRVDERLLRPAPAPGTLLAVHELAPGGVLPTVGALRLFPGISGRLLRDVLPRLQGLVLEAYGLGNGPSRDPEFLAALRAASDRGVVIVDCSQCLRGRVDLAGYATGRALAEAGVVSGYDMTAEAALAKLYYLLSQGLPPDAVRQRIREDLRGELSV
jgi:L-asparaginase